MKKAAFDSKPLYRQTVKLAALIERLMGKCTRQYRFTMGQRLVDRAMRLPTDFRRAYDETDESLRLARINILRQHFYDVRICIDVAHELHLFSQKDFSMLLDELGAVDRQIDGWYRSTDARVSVTRGDG